MVVGPTTRDRKWPLRRFSAAPGRAQQASFADLPWWEVFKDETLKALIDTALANNYDLAMAVSRVEQARQLAAVASSQYFPLLTTRRPAMGIMNLSAVPLQASCAQGFLSGPAA